MRRRRPGEPLDLNCYRARDSRQNTDSDDNLETNKHSYKRESKIYRVMKRFLMEDPSVKKPASAPPDPLVGKVIDKYVILERLGKGGMGLVYKAQHKRIKRFAALKLLPARDARDEISVKRLEREATAMGNLQHPGIATMFDFGVTPEGQPYIVLELMKGQNLKSILKEAGRLAPEYALAISIQIAEAMEYAHAQGIMHRDLKPENIMFTEEGNKGPLKVLDFGIARHTEESLMLTKTGQIVGSAAYMSPEQCSGKKPVDNRTDIYALGVIMYEILTGNLPHKGNTFLETIYLKTTEHPSPFPESLSKIGGLEDLVRSCLMVEPDDRPQSMENLKIELRRIADAIATGSIQVPTSIHVTSPNLSQSQAHASNATNSSPGATTEDGSDRTVVATTMQDHGTDSNTPKKVTMAILLVAVVSALTVAVLSFLGKDNATVSKQDHESHKSTHSRPLSPPTKLPEPIRTSHEELAPGGTGLGADSLMGAKKNEVRKEKRENRSKSLQSKKATSASTKSAPARTYSKPAKRAETQTQTHTRSTTPPLAPPIARTTPAPQVSSSTRNIDREINSAVQRNTKLRSASYYLKKLDGKARGAGRKIDNKLQRLINKL